MNQTSKISTFPFIKGELLGTAGNLVGASGEENLYYNRTCTTSGLICGLQEETRKKVLRRLLAQSGQPVAFDPPEATICFHISGSRNIWALDRSNNQYGNRSTIVLTLSTDKSDAFYVNKGIPVQPLTFQKEDISISHVFELGAMRSTEAFNGTRTAIVQCLMSHNDYSYSAFKDLEFLSRDVAKFIEETTDFFDKFLRSENLPEFATTLVDLSSLSHSPQLCSLLFDLALVSWRKKYSKFNQTVVCEDPAHYLKNNTSLTTSISALSHPSSGVRVLLCTQDPTTLPYTVLENISFVILHEITSPRWVAHIEAIRPVKCITSNSMYLEDNGISVCSQGQRNALNLWPAYFVRLFDTIGVDNDSYDPLPASSKAMHEPQESRDQSIVPLSPAPTSSKIESVWIDVTHKRRETPTRLVASSIIPDDNATQISSQEIKNYPICFFWYLLDAIEDARDEAVKQGRPSPNKIRHSIVAQKWGPRERSRVGLSFKEYVQAAVTKGVIVAKGTGDEAWIALPEWNYPGKRRTHHHDMGW